MISLSVAEKVVRNGQYNGKWKEISARGLERVWFGDESTVGAKCRVPQKPSKKTPGCDGK